MSHDYSDSLYSPLYPSVTLDGGESTENDFDLDQSHNDYAVGLIYANEVNFYNRPEPGSTDENEAEDASWKPPLEEFAPW